MVSTLFSLAQATDVSAETLVLNNVGASPLTNDQGTGFLDVIGKEAFRRNGIKLSLIKLPAERGLSNANAGIDDGDFLRVSGMEKLYPNLVQVPEKLVDMTFVAFANDPAVRVDGWGSLRNYYVGFIKGWKILEKNTPNGTLVILARDAEQLFTMLEKRRVDVILYSRLMGLEIIRRRKLAGVMDSSPPLAVRGMFIYLNKRHQALASKISSALAAIKAEGLYDAEYRKVKAGLGMTE
ncbi:MAG: transporter substrate-binding domain-containing protein [Rhodospirillales bacterium]|nr:transporter substrate-binding domain-containing protein [Rhodospirillales bacterium]